MNVRVVDTDGAEAQVVWTMVDGGSVRIFIENVLGFANDGEKTFHDVAHTFSDRTDLPAQPILAGRVVQYFVRQGHYSLTTEKPIYRVPLISEIAAF